MNIVEMIKSIYELCWAGPSWGPGEGNTFPLLFTMTCFWGGQTNPNNYCRLAMRTSRPHHAEIVLQGQANTLEYHFLSKQKLVQRWACHSAVKESCRLDPCPGCCYPRATVIIKDSVPRSLFLMKQIIPCRMISLTHTLKLLFPDHKEIPFVSVTICHIIRNF